MRTNKITPIRIDWIADLGESFIDFWIYDPWEKGYVAYSKLFGLMYMDSVSLTYKSLDRKSAKTTYTKTLLKVVKKAMKSEEYQIPDKPALPNKPKKKRVKKEKPEKGDLAKELEKKRIAADKSRAYYRKKKEAEIKRKQSLLSSEG